MDEVTAGFEDITLVTGGEVKNWDQVWVSMQEPV